jgi:hypothetical protein
MRIFYFLLFTAIFSINLPAQSLTKEEIIKSNTFYYGTGISSDENQARDEALREISEQIAVKVSSQFESKVKEVNLDIQQKVTSIINTYSTATLSEVESIRKMNPDGKTEVFCYISKDNVKKVFDARKALIMQMFRNGNQNEEEANLLFALKNYYFGMVLLLSLPDENVIVQDVNLTVEIPKCINRILQGVEFSLVKDSKTSEKERDLAFKVTYKGKPVSLCQYRFWDGNQISGYGQVRDGKTLINLVGPSVGFSNLKVFIEYENFQARREFAAVEQLWDLVVRPEFTNLVNISLSKETSSLILTDSPLSLKFESENASTEAIVQETNRLISNLEKGDENTISESYKTDTFLQQKILSYIRNNHPKPYKGATEALVNSTRTGYEVRKIGMLHQYPTINRQSTEYIVLDFDQKGILIDFNLCITDDLYEKFVQQATYGNDWGNRQEIIKFIEKYRTAYLTRDMSTIDLMFAEEALILVGRKIEARNKPNKDVAYVQLPGQPGYEQLQFTKQQYLARQKEIFNLQKDIFIDFSTFEIMKKNNSPNVYGVEMRQNYSSTTYADEGYLFLLIDFNENDPLIYIRAWQPNEWDRNALVNTSNFRIYK